MIRAGTGRRLRCSALLCLYGFLMPVLSPAAGEDAALPSGGGAELLVATAHRSGVSSLHWSRDGRRLLSTSADNTAKLWDVASGTLLRTLSGDKRVVRGRGNSLYAGVLLPDGRHALLAGTAGSQLWDLPGGRAVKFLDAADHFVHELALDAAGLLAVTAGSGPASGGARPFLRLHRLDGAGVAAADALPSDDLQGVSHLALSPDGRRLAIAGKRLSAAGQGGVTPPVLRILDTGAGRVLQQLEPPDEVQGLAFAGNDEVYFWTFSQLSRMRVADGQLLGSIPAGQAAVSADGRYLALRPPPAQDGGGDMAVYVRDTASGQQQRIPWPDPEREITTSHLDHLAFSPDHGQLALGFSNGKVAVWDLGRQRYARIWNPRPFGPRRIVAADASLSHLALPTPRGAAVWDLRRGRHSVQPSDVPPQVLVLSPDGTLLAAGDDNGRVRIWETASGRLSDDQLLTAGGIRALAFDGDNRLAVADHASVVFWESGGTAPATPFAQGMTAIFALAFSADGGLLAIGDELGEVHLRATRGGRDFPVIKAPDISPTVLGLAFDDAGRRIVVAYGNGFHKVISYALDGTDARVVGEHAAAVDSIALVGDIVATGSEDETVSLWSHRDGTHLAQLPHSGEVLGVALSRPASRLAVYADFALHLWNISDPRKPRRIAQAMELEGSRWVTATPQGMFDISDLGRVQGLGWLLPDAALQPLPPEIFARDYFQPNLLPRLMSCEAASPAEDCATAFGEKPALDKLNRLRPRIEIRSVTATPDRRRAQVVVHVWPGKDPAAPEGQKYTDAYDLRLLRDGQVVGRSPRLPVEALPAAAKDRDAVLATWRRHHRLVVPAGEDHYIQAFDVALPSQAPPVFSAYAFNEDRVKTETVEGPPLPPLARPVPRPRRAYVITMGINDYGGAATTLSFAVDDATAIQAALAQIPGYEVVPLSLLAPVGSKTPPTASKAHLRAVLARLGGLQADGALLASIRGAQRIATATPDDLVILSFSGHGHAAADGSFYLLPSPLPPAGADPLQHYISSEELGEWLEPVDAGELAMIIDACHAAASVEQPGFKPGPMGDRGLGQLAYDKRMRILAASQADNVALESPRLRRGLLTYALTADGFARRRADYRAADLDEDQVLMLSEWLRYGEQQTPLIYEDVRSGRREFVVPGKNGERDIYSRDPTIDPRFGQTVAAKAQLPVLFDFSRQDSDLAIVSWKAPRSARDLPEKVVRELPDRWTRP